MCAKKYRAATEHGQIVVVAAVVLALMAAALVGLAIIGSAAIDRHRAAVGADMTALAAAQDRAAGDQVAAWYRSQGVDLTIGASPDGGARADGEIPRHEGPAARASSFAELRAGEVPKAPAMVAIMARAEQLVGRPLDVTHSSATAVRIASADWQAISSLDEPLGLCVEAVTPAAVHAGLCGARP